MKIMSLNVDQFRVLRLSEGCWAKEIVAFVKGFLCKDDNNVAFLYEIPHYAGSGGQFYGKLDLFNNFEDKFPKTLYKTYYSDVKAYICTMAITNEKSDWERIEDGFKVYNEAKEEIKQNRYVELICKGAHDSQTLKVLGVHADTRILPALAEYIETVKTGKNIVLGDLNCHRGKRSCNGKYLKQMETHFQDLIDSETVTYFSGETTIDHVLVSSALQGKVTAEVIPQKALELSDHAVIIVDVDL